jgi:hypothetical protein
VVVAVVALVWAIALADVVRTPEDRVRTLPRPAWLVIVFFGSVLGAVSWLILGRPIDQKR